MEVTDNRHVNLTLPQPVNDFWNGSRGLARIYGYADKF
jgi:hypothetical protein